jgi:hypothetical protein
MTRSDTIAALAEAFSGFRGYWTGVPGYSWLWISAEGDVASTYRGRAQLLKGTRCGRYLAVAPTASGAKRYVHALICEAFHGPRPDGHEVRHLDGDRTNNAARNLAWGTPQQNSDDKRVHGTVAAGERNPMAKLTAAIVAEMRRVRASEGLSYHLIGRRFGVSTMAAYRAVEMQSWK